MLPKVTMSVDEAETCINYCLYHIGEWAEVYTTDKTIMNRYEKFAAKHPEYCKVIKDDKYSMTFSVHPKCASLRPKAPRKSNLSEEAKQANAERLRNMLRRKTEKDLDQE